MASSSSTTVMMDLPQDTASSSHTSSHLEHSDSQKDLKVTPVKKASLLERRPYASMWKTSLSLAPPIMIRVNQLESLAHALKSGLSTNNFSSIKDEFARLKKLALPEEQRNWDDIIQYLIEKYTFIEGNYHGNIIGALILTGNERAVAFIKELGNYTEETFLKAKKSAIFSALYIEKGGDDDWGWEVKIPEKSNQTSLMLYAIQNAQLKLLERLPYEVSYEPNKWRKAVYNFAINYITVMDGYYGSLIDHGLYALIKKPSDPRIFTTLRRIIGGKDFESKVQHTIQYGSLHPTKKMSPRKSPMRIAIENGSSPDDLKQLEEAGGYEPKIFAMQVKQKQFHMSEQKSIVKNGYRGSELQHALFTCDQRALDELYQKSGYATGKEFVVEAIAGALSSPWIEERKGVGKIGNEEINDIIVEIILSPDLSSSLEKIRQSLIFIVSKDKESKTDSVHEAWAEAWLDDKIDMQVFTYSRERGNLIQDLIQDVILSNDKFLLNRLNNMYIAFTQKRLVNKLQKIITKVFQDLIQNSPEETIENIQREFVVKFRQKLQEEIEELSHPEILKDLQNIIQTNLQETIARDLKAIEETLQHTILEYFQEPIRNLCLQQSSLYARAQACKLNHTVNMQTAPSIIQIALLDQDEKTLIFCRDNLEVGIEQIRQQIESLMNTQRLERFRNLNVAQVSFLIKAGNYTKEEFLQKIPKELVSIRVMVDICNIPASSSQVEVRCQQRLFTPTPPNLTCSTISTPSNAPPSGAPTNSH